VKIAVLLTLLAALLCPPAFAALDWVVVDKAIAPLEALLARQRRPSHKQRAQTGRRNSPEGYSHNPLGTDRK